MLRFDFKTYMKDLAKEISVYAEEKEKMKEQLCEKGVMNGWIDVEYSSMELEKIKEIVTRIRNNSEVLIVLGIGGSYLGSKAVIDALHPYFLSSSLEVIFAGNNLSSEYYHDLLKYIDGKEVSINIISKSGTTLEPNLGFAILYLYMKEKYTQEELKRRIIVTTSHDNNELYNLAIEKEYDILSVPKNIGGRFSVLTSVGLLPILASGIDVNELLRGAKDGITLFDDAYLYASIRDILFHQDYQVEAYTIYEDKLYMFTEWLKQLFAETQGKNNKGLLPISIVNTRDLHSLGQFIQEGSPILFETVLEIRNGMDVNLENNVSLRNISQLALEKVCEAHYSDNRFSSIISMDSLDAYHLGLLIYFFFLSSAIGGYLLEVNPYDQPGVNKYKDLLNNALAN